MHLKKILNPDLLLAIQVCNPTLPVSRSLNFSNIFVNQYMMVGIHDHQETYVFNGKKVKSMCEYSLAGQFRFINDPRALSFLSMLGRFSSLLPIYTPGWGHCES